MSLKGKHHKKWLMHYIVVIFLHYLYFIVVVILFWINLYFLSFFYIFQWFSYLLSIDLQFILIYVLVICK